MEIEFTFLLQSTKSYVKVTAKSLPEAAAKCRRLYCTPFIMLHSSELSAAK